jgi:hypothetical protein
MLDTISVAYWIPAYAGMTCKHCTFFNNLSGRLKYRAIQNLAPHDRNRCLTV